MTLKESSIYVRLRRLRKLLYQAQFLMNKADRIVYGTPLMQASAETMKNYVLAFTIKEEKLEYINRAIGWYSVLRTDLDFCVEENLIHYAKRKPKVGEAMTAEDYVSSKKVELFEIVARIDDEMLKYRASLAKGKTIVG